MQLKPSAVLSVGTDMQKNRHTDDIPRVPRHQTSLNQGSTGEVTTNLATFTIEQEGVLRQLWEERNGRFLCCLPFAYHYGSVITTMFPGGSRTLRSLLADQGR